MCIVLIGIRLIQVIKMELEEAVIQLHDVARLVEKQIGIGALSEDIRKCADRLHALLKDRPNEKIS